MATRIQVPSLKERAGELSRIVDEYALDATTALLKPPTSFTAEDRKWVLEHAARSLDDIEKATLRRVAIRTSDSSTDAANHLGVAQVSLGRWMTRHASATRGSGKP